MALIWVSQKKDSKKVYVNPDHIVSIYSRHDGTCIHTNAAKSANETGYVILVTESVEEVASRVATAQGG